MAFPTSQLSQENILRDVHDQAEQRLRVDSQVTAIVENVTVDVNLDAADDNVAIKDPVSNNILNINGDGSINANVNINHADDSIRLGDGTSLITATTIGPKVGLDINVLNQVTDYATDSSLASILIELQQKTEPNDVQNIRNLSSVTDSVSVPGVASETTLSSINSKLNTLGQKPMSGSIPVTFANDQTPLTVSVGNEPFKVSGTKDGTTGGIEYTFVNNERQQILESHDRIDTYTYADFGTKDQRIIRVDYTSATFPGIVVRRDFNYVLDGNKYKRTNSPWTIV